MIEKIETLKNKLFQAFPEGYVVIELKVSDFEENRWYLGIQEIGVCEFYQTWEALDHDAHFLLSKQAKGVYDDDLCDKDIVSQAEEIKNSTAPWNKF